MKKKKRPTAAARELDRSWQEILRQHSAPLERGARSWGLARQSRAQPKTQPIPTPEVARRDAFAGMRGVAARAPDKVYTGDKIIGVAVMHKSNLVPIFNEQAAVEVAQMRRN
jgi:hypothetical protein